MIPEKGSGDPLVNDAHPSGEDDEQRRRLETLGRLAGHLVHDFNNLLMVIEGYTRLLLEDGSLSPAATENTLEILRATERAAALSRQILAFSRKKPQTVLPLDVHAELRRMRSMMSRLLGETVALDYDLQAEFCILLAAPGELEQVLLNLIVNARDAMPVGGRIVVRTRQAGDRSFLEVHDTGGGVPASLQSKIFEPYFTTKAPGRGSGIGLAQVRNTVEAWGAAIELKSVEGQGSEFTVHWPTPNLQSSPPSPIAVPVILLVEDEAGIRTLIRRVLEQRGYVVREAATESVALQLARSEVCIDLLITDLELPGGDGRRLASLVRQSHPAAQTLYISGYDLSPGEKSEIFLQKPFVPNTLVLTVQHLLKSDRT